MGYINKVFLILKGKNSLSRVPVQIFLSKNYENARLYFQGYIFGENNPWEYLLYQIGTIEKNGKINENKIFICGGIEIEKKQKNDYEKIKQLKLNEEKRIEAEKEKDIIKQIEILFNGKRI